jgi:hypothetical protein
MPGGRTERARKRLRGVWLGNDMYSPPTTISPNPPGRRRASWPWALSLLAVVYVSLAMPLVVRQGAHWDEQTDLGIAAAYLDGPLALFVGSTDDAINTRLPMLVVALLGPTGAELSVRNARLVSLALGVSTLIGSYWLACLLFDRRRGLLAAALLATSPYFLAYSPLALTEGDAFVAAAGVWIAIAAARFAAKPTWLRAAVLGLALGLGIGAKVSAIAFVPAVGLGTLLPSALAAPRSSRRVLLRESWPWLAVMLALAAWLLVQTVATGTALPPLGQWVPLILQRRSVRYLLVFAAWAGLVGWAWRARARTASAPGRLLVPPLLAALTVFVFPPDHTTNSAIFRITAQTSMSSGHEITPLFLAEVAAFHFMVLLLKPSVPIGAALWAGVAYAAATLRRRPQLTTLVAMIAFYEVFLFILPLAQVRYQMAVFPLVVIVGSDFLVTLGGRHRLAAILVALVVAAGLVYDYRSCYPDLNLNGYQWLGSRYFAGRATLAYRGIGQVGEDGVEQALRWCEANVERTAAVVSYVSARNLVGYLLPRPPFVLIDGLTDRDALARADYVLTSINGDLVDGDGPDNPTGDPFKYPSYDRAALERDFTPVFSVRRSFDIEVASVWRRR